ncbi:MAG: type II toxin-antitoxin system Phd/YefM family antitoxin [Oscillospiraceae bacterium]|nr:type II toxin-antitoxin system Phd/YefM family antitoxin [Oscillospiraceae bacterium]
MKFYSTSDLRTGSKSLWQDLSSEEEIVITSNGKPAALMIDISENNFDDTVQAVRQARSMIAFNSMRKIAAFKGFITDEEIEAEIRSARSRE